MWFYTKLINIALTALYATCNIMELMCGGDLAGKLFCIKVEIKKNVENFLNIDGASCKLLKRQKHRERHCGGYVHNVAGLS